MNQESGVAAALYALINLITSCFKSVALAWFLNLREIDLKMNRFLDHELIVVNTYNAMLKGKISEEIKKGIL